MTAVKTNYPPNVSLWTNESGSLQASIPNEEALEKIKEELTRLRDSLQVGMRVIVSQNQFRTTDSQPTHRLGAFKPTKGGQATAPQAAGF